MTAAILSRAGRCTWAPKSFNNRIGVPLTLLKADVEDDFVVLEMGTNHHGEIEELARFARPHAGLITCIGDCHLEGLGNRRGVMEAKGELIPHLKVGGLLALNADDPLCMELTARHAGPVRTFGFSRVADVRPVGLRWEGEGQAFEIARRSFRLPASGRHNVLNAAAAICLAGWAGATSEQASEALAQIVLPGLRFEKRRIGGVEYVLDCYNSNPTAMRAALSTILEESRGRRLVVVCGDMLELGQAGPSMHMHLGRVMALTGVDTLVAVGTLGRYVVRGWSEFAGEGRKAFHLPSVDEAWQVVQENVGPGDIVLIKGSRAMRLETIPDAIVRQMTADRQEAVA
jgi:UDP-N-acetylmuramoyl-tripeptide--D-alanyl-D-alanine ligase